MAMTKLEYTVSFNTPAFLGNAQQQAQWRTPPFKALIRQWWRVVKAKECGYDHSRLLKDEGALFGSASDEGTGASGKSLVRLRLSEWGLGTYDRLESSGGVRHPEVNRPEIEANLYLGYGPVNTRGLVRPPAISPGGRKISFRLTVPNDRVGELQNAIQLAAWFGTLGSRSRNGWGALQLSGANIERIDNLNSATLLPYSRNLRDCLQLDWPHAIGRDDKGMLVWKTRPMNGWREAMKELARTKIAFRTQFKFTAGGPHNQMMERLLLAYPVTRHNHVKLAGDSRLANQIRFKVAKTDDGFIGVIAHLPCKLPDVLLAKLSTHDTQWVRNNELEVWQAVHEVLDRELAESSKHWRSLT